MRKKISTAFAVLLILSMISCSSQEDKLFRAIKTGDAGKVSELIEDGASVLETNKNGLTPLDIARLNGQTEIAGLLYDQVKRISEKDINLIMTGKFEKQLNLLKEVDRKRIRSYNSYLSANEKLLNLISDDKRISNDLIMEEEKYFKLHQALIKDYINSKVDLIDEIEKEFDTFNYAQNITKPDKRHIINVNIMFRLSNMN